MVNEGNYQKSLKKRKIEYIVVHYTAGHNDTAKNNVEYFAKNNVGASAHYFVDSNEWLPSVPENDIAYAVGTAGCYTQKHPKCRNYNSISVEMCCLLNGYDIGESTYENAQVLIAKLMLKYQIPIEKVIRHWDVVNKKCPAPLVNNFDRWIDFKKGVYRMFGKECYEAIKSYLGEQQFPDYFKKEFHAAQDMGITDGTNPMQLITRAQAAVMAKRAVDAAIKNK